MLTIIKYEIIRQKLSKWLMLGLLGVLEVLFLFFLWQDKSEALAFTIAGLTFLALFGFLYVSLESIINYNQDLSKKSGYMLFLTPNSVYEILGAKIINSILTIVATACVFGAAAFADVMLIALRYDDLKAFWDQIQSFLNDFAQLDISAGAIISGLVLAVIFWISTVAIAFLALTLTYTFLHAAPAKVLISFVIFIVLNLLYSWVDNLLLNALPDTYAAQALGTGLLTASVAVVCLWLDGWMLTRKLAL